MYVCSIWILRVYIEEMCVCVCVCVWSRMKKNTYVDVVEAESVEDSDPVDESDAIIFTNVLGVYVRLL